MGELFDQDANDNKTYSLAVIEADGIQILVEVFADGQVHVATREESWNTWSPGGWSIMKVVEMR